MRLPNYRFGSQTVFCDMFSIKEVSHDGVLFLWYDDSDMQSEPTWIKSTYRYSREGCKDTSQYPIH